MFAYQGKPNRNRNLKSKLWIGYMKIKWTFKIAPNCFRIYQADFLNR